jgi:hypothetical protein
MLRQTGQGCPSNPNARHRGARFLAADLLAI